MCALKHITFIFVSLATPDQAYSNVLFYTQMLASLFSRNAVKYVCLTSHLMFNVYVLALV